MFETQTILGFHSYREKWISFPPKLFLASYASQRGPIIYSFALCTNDAKEELNIQLAQRNKQFTMLYSQAQVASIVMKLGFLKNIMKSTSAMCFIHSFIHSLNLLNKTLPLLQRVEMRFLMCFEKSLIKKLQNQESQVFFAWNLSPHLSSEFRVLD